MKSRLLTIFALVFLANNLGFSQSAVCSYKYRKRIVFDPARVSGPSDLSNFPALINISSDNDLRTVANSGHVENANGYDVVFTADDGVTLLTFQLEKYTATNGQYTAWVLLPNLSTSIKTVIYMYYGNTAIITDQSSNSVWTNYHGVWHLENSSFSDNSPSGYNLTNNGTTNQAAAAINGGRADNGTQWLEVSSSFPNMNADFTMSAWIYSGNVGTAGQRVFCDDVNNTSGYALSLGDPGSGALRFYARGTNPISLDTPNNTITNNTWYFVSAVADVTNKVKRIFVNGVQIVSATYTGTWGTDNGNSSIAGETASGETGNRLNGRIDEVHVAKSALSADWILTEYNNQSSPATFYSITPEPAVWDGSSSSNWNTNANWVSGTVPASMEDVILTNVGSAPSLNANKQIASLWIQSGTTLSFNNNRVLSVAYDIVNCGTLLGGGGTSGVELNSSNSEVQVQHLSGSGTYSFTELTINNTYSLNPSVTLNKNINVVESLTLTSGLVNTGSTNIIAMESGATITNGSATSYINGPMTKDGTAAFVFPVGKGGKWRRIGISGPTSTSVFRAEYFNAPFTTTNNVNAPLNDISTVEYWQLDRLSGSGNASVTLYWEDAGVSGINNCSDLTIARWNGASWDERAAATVGGSSCSGTGTGAVTTTAVVTAFSPFTFGSKLGGGTNPLPIELISFEAECIHDGVKLHWSTATEKNNAFFYLEKSADGQNWQELKRMRAAINSQVTLNYSYVDSVLLSDAPAYYRLSAIDIYGNADQPVSLALSCSAQQNDWTLFPNPLESGTLNVELHLTSDYGNGSLAIYNSLGELCYRQEIYLRKGTTRIQIPLSLNQGSYLVKLNTHALMLPTQKLIIR